MSPKDAKKALKHLASAERHMREAAAYLVGTPSWWPAYRLAVEAFNLSITEGQRQGVVGFPMSFNGAKP